MKRRKDTKLPNGQLQGTLESGLPKQSLTFRMLLTGCLNLSFIKFKSYLESAARNLLRPLIGTKQCLEIEIFFEPLLPHDSITSVTLLI